MGVSLQEAPYQYETAQIKHEYQNVATDDAIRDLFVSPEPYAVFRFSVCTLLLAIHSPSFRPWHWTCDADRLKHACTGHDVALEPAVNGCCSM